MNKTFPVIILLLVIAAAGYLFFSAEQVEDRPIFNEEVHTFLTDDTEVRVQYSYEGDYAQVTVEGETYDLDRVVSASGAKYESADGSVMFWEHQGEATLVINSQEIVVQSTQMQPADDLLTFNVSPEKVACVGVAPMECLVVNGEYFYDNITGFEFEQGYEYTLLVDRTERENVPADASIYEYTLVEVVSKAEVSTDISTDSTLADTSWQWQETQYNNNDLVTANEPEEFILTFTEEGRFSATTDCNNVGGSFTAGEANISFSQMMSTEMACMGDTQEEAFTKMLAETNGYLITEEGNLALTLKYDTGSMIFTPVGE
jgi:heat shock protein HslJ/membrane-bound inhibitor of C-type lysozyme